MIYKGIAEAIELIESRDKHPTMDSLKMAAGKLRLEQEIMTQLQSQLTAEQKVTVKDAIIKHLRGKAEFDMPADMRGRFHNACTDSCDMIDGPCACGAWHNAKEWIKNLCQQVSANKKIERAHLATAKEERGGLKSRAKTEEVMSKMFDGILQLTAVNRHEDGSHEVKSLELEQVTNTIHDLWVDLQFELTAAQEEKEVDKLRSRIKIEEEIRNDDSQKGFVDSDIEYLCMLASYGKTVVRAGWLKTFARKIKLALAEIEMYKDAMAIEFNAEMCEALKPLRAKNELLEGIIVRFKATCKITGKGPVDKDCEALRLANEKIEKWREHDSKCMIFRHSALGCRCGLFTDKIGGG